VIQLTTELLQATVSGGVDAGEAMDDDDDMMKDVLKDYEVRRGAAHRAKQAEEEDPPNPLRASGR
jgi:hypothetical protein